MHLACAFLLLCFVVACLVHYLHTTSRSANNQQQKKQSSAGVRACLVLYMAPTRFFLYRRRRQTTCFAQQKGGSCSPSSTNLQVKRIRGELEIELGREPTKPELALEAGLSVQQVEACLEQVRWRRFVLVRSVDSGQALFLGGCKGQERRCCSVVGAARGLETTIMVGLIGGMSLVLAFGLGGVVVVLAIVLWLLWFRP